MPLLVEEYRTARDALRYGFAVGRVRILQTRLLDAAALERLIDAQDYAEQRRLLSDTPYGRFLESAHTPTEVEEALEDSLESAYRFLDEAGLSEPAVRFFRVRADFLNLKAAIKARLLSVPLDGLLVPHGSLSVEAFHGELERLPAPFGELAAEVLESAAGRLGADVLHFVESRVDSALYTELSRVARETASPFVAGLAKRMSDFANLKIALRSRRAGVKPEDLASSLISSGNVAPTEFVRLLTLPDQEVAAFAERRLGVPAETILAEGAVGDLDIAVDNALIAAVRRGRRPEPGAEDIIAYVFAREVETQHLRVALLGKLAGLSPVDLHRRMRALLV